MEQEKKKKEYPRKFLPMLPRYELDSMDHTATKEFKKCPRSFFLRMVLGKTTPDGKWESVFAWGSAVHKFLEVLYETGDIGQATITALPIFRAPTNPKFDFQTRERLMLTFAELAKMYQGEKSNKAIEVLAIEQPFMIQFPDGNTVGGRWDQLINWNGRVWIRDWKTTSKIKQYFAQGLDPNDQATRYIWSASALHFGMDENGYPNRVIDGVLFTAITNMKTAKREGTNTGVTIENVMSTRTMNQVRAWVDDQVFIHKQIELCYENDTWPMYEVNCTFCNFRSVCTQSSQAAMENMLRTQYLTKPWKHSEVDQAEVKGES